MIELIGKKPQKLYFDTVIARKSLAHFYILEGDSGVGKKTLADYIAASIHCESGIGVCGVCGSCVKHRTGNHPDYIEIKNDDPDKKQLSVETVRQYTRDIYTKPLLADKKIYVLTDKVPPGREAQNAFLKVLEEPPAYAVIFFLVNNAEILLPTVRSRGVVCHIDGCTRNETIKYISEQYPEAADRAGIIASFSGGNLGLAVSLAREGDFFGRRSELFDLLSYVPLGKRSGLCEITAYFAAHKELVPELLGLLISWLRDALCIKSVGADNLINADYGDRLRGFSAAVTADKIIKTLDAAEEMAASFPKGGNTEIWMADLMTKLS